MGNIELAVTDLPLGTLFPDAAYNRHLLQAMASHKAGNLITRDEITILERKRLALWDEALAIKSQGMHAFGTFAARQYGFGLTQENRLDFQWKTADYRRIAYDSDYFACDVRNKKLVSVNLDIAQKKVIVFATGRAFAEKNSRLGSIEPEDATDNARNVMSAQVYLVESRLVPGDRDVQVVAMAYDMVTSDEETPALRIQAILDPSFLHQVSIRSAERIFGPLIGELETYPTGMIVRREGRILGRPLADDVIIENLSKVVLVGGSVGCIITLQVAFWLDELLSELGVSDAVREEAARAFLIVNLGPTMTLAPPQRTNVISVINKNDEFVVSGNHIAPLLARMDEMGRNFVPDISGQMNSFTVVLDVPGTIYFGDGGPDTEPVFDPLGSHFGHSMKHYANGLRNMGFSSLIGRVLDQSGGFVLSEIIDAAVAAGELNIHA
jgi:hypothetical protein